MNCPECNEPCDRDSVDVGVGIISIPWFCTACAWDEDQAFPMSPSNWQDWLGAGPNPDSYLQNSC